MGTPPKQAEILSNLITRLRGDAGITALVSTRIYNHVPQDEPFPFVRARWGSESEWDTKDSQGFSGSLIIDIWVEVHGDSSMLFIKDAIYLALHEIPFSPTTGQGVCLRYSNGDSFVEPDGVSHHGVMNFNYIVTN